MPAPEPAGFDAHVRQRGARAIQRLLGQPVKAPGRKPKVIYADPQDIPTASFPECWTDAWPDGESALDKMMTLYGQQCAYLAMRLERATGSPTVDHFVARGSDWRLVYEWSNYRLSASCVNGAKGTAAVVDPFEVQPGWFQLNLDRCKVERGPDAPAEMFDRIDETLKLLNLRQCIKQRAEYISLYREGRLDLGQIQMYAPFIAAELQRQGQLRDG